MKILITHSYFLHFDPKQLAGSKPYPPLATLLAAACMRNEGHEVHFYDVSFDQNTGSFQSHVLSLKPEILVVYDDGFNYLTKMCLTNMREAALQMAAIAASQGITSIISSSDSTDQLELYLSGHFDYVLLGESEDTLLELLSALQKQDNTTAILGLATKQNGQVIATAKRPVRQNLDELPMAAWDLLSIQPYKDAWKKQGYFSLNMATTRGCPYKCNWCAKPIYGNRYNSRSPKHVLDELIWMHRLFAFDHIWFCDDIFGLKPNWVQEFHQVLSASGIRFRYKIQSRADLLTKEDTLFALAQSGADEIWIGAESGSQKVLDAMDKGITVAQIHEATLGMRKHDIKPCFFLQVGYPGEEWEDIQATLRMVEELQPHDIGVSVSYPLPGTVFYDRVKSQLKEKTHWKDSDELLLMYQSTFSPSFYKTLHRFIHKSFRAKQSLERMRKKILTPAFPKMKDLSFIYFKPAAWMEQKKLNKLRKHGTGTL